MTSFVDNSHTLPDRLFREPEAWSQIFVQDAKVVGDRVFTCEFGLGMASCWDQFIAPGLERAVQILNQNNRIWVMVDNECMRKIEELEGQNSFIHIVQRALGSKSENRFGIDTPYQPMPAFPPVSERPFDPRAIESYSTIAIAPYSLPAEQFKEIEGTTKPTLLLDEGSGVGPCLRTYSYKHISRLVMNGTAASAQNPPYIMIETTYRPDLAAFVKSRFPDDDTLVLKVIAATRGKGVFALSAHSVETLDKELQNHFKENSEFRSCGSFSVCIIERFISNAGAELREKAHRFCYLALKNHGETEVHVTGGRQVTACDDIAQGTKASRIVKAGHLQRVDDDTLSRIHHIVNRDMACVATRAISYQPQEAVRYFLSSDNHILNLIGIELFEPALLCSYRQLCKNKNSLFYRVTDEQCDLFIALLKRNASQIVRQRIFDNVVCNDWFKAYKDPESFILSQQLGSLFAELFQTTADGPFRNKLASFLAFAVQNVRSASMFAFIKPFIHPNASQIPA